MVTNKLEGKPKEILRLLKEWATEKEIPLQNLPSYTTIHRLMKKFEKTPLMNQESQKPFHYPEDMEYVGWEHGRVPLECLHYYSRNFRIRPAVGLVQWFCRMAEARKSDLSDSETLSIESTQIGLYAEICWFSEIVKSLGKPAPNLMGLELQLSWKSWEGNSEVGFRSDAEEKGINPNGPLVEIDESYWLLLTDMPTFMAHKSDEFDTQVHTWEKEQQTSKDKPRTSQSAQKATESDGSDFSWYLEKFPDLQKRDD